MLRLLLILVFLTVLGIPVGAAVAVLYAVDDEPLVDQTTSLTPSDIQRARRLLGDHDPRRLQPGQTQTLSLSQQDLELLVNHLAAISGKGGARVRMQQGGLEVLATFILPANPLGSYLNFDLAMTEGLGLPRFERLRVGALPIPAGLADRALRAALRSLADEQRGLGVDVIREVRLADAGLHVTYEWDPAALHRVREKVVQGTDEERLRLFQHRLIQTAEQAPARKAVSLTALMEPLFAFGYSRSKTGDPVADNRAAITVLTAYVNGRSLRHLVGNGGQFPRSARRTVSLRGRHDFAQHFMTSAALAATGGGVLSDAIGLYKEVEDSRGGSGFSFTDIGADRAGTRFGEEAVRSYLAARLLQRRIGEGVREADIIPELLDLPEFLTEAEFNRRYGGLEGAGYRRLTQVIEDRLNELRLYR